MKENSKIRSICENKEIKTTVTELNILSQIFNFVVNTATMQENQIVYVLFNLNISILLKNLNRPTLISTLWELVEFHYQCQLTYFNIQHFFSFFVHKMFYACSVTCWSPKPNSREQMQWKIMNIWASCILF